MSKAQTKIEKLLKELQGYTDSAREEMTTIMSDGRYSAEYRRQLLQSSQSQWASIAHRGAKNAWKDYQRMLREADEAVGRATVAKDHGLNLALVEMKRSEYAAVLRSNALFGQTVAMKVEDLAQQAKYSAEGKRALALAVAGLPGLGDVGDPHANSVRATLRQWEAEADKPRQEAVAELQALQRAEGELATAIYTLETEHTGEQASMFHPLTEWGRSIFELTPESMGLLTSRTDDDGHGFVGQADAMPSGPVPAGVLVSEK